MSSCPFGFSSEKNLDKENPEIKESQVQLYLIKGYDKNFLPSKPNIYVDWWERDSKTKNHARFCMPLLMANVLGYDILSPATFEVFWDGDDRHDAQVKIIDKCSHAVIDNHSAKGSFTVQSQFIPKTKKGYYIYIKGIPNIRRPFSVMEGLIETWWNPAHFGLVCLCNSPSKFTIVKGEPIARMVLLHQDALKVKLEIKDDESEIYQRKEFLEKRTKQTSKVLDYFKGLYPNGEKVEHHIKPTIYNENII